MGQAKHRGTREQRVAEGVAKREAREKDAAERKQARWNAMTRKERMEYVQLVGLITALTMPPNARNQLPA